MFADRVFVRRRYKKCFEVNVKNVWDGKFFLGGLVMQNRVFPYGIGHGLWCVLSSRECVCRELVDN